MAASAAVQASALGLGNVQLAPSNFSKPCGGNRELVSFVGLKSTSISNVAKSVGSETLRKTATTSASLMTTNGSVTTYTQAPLLKEPAKLIDSVETFVLDCDGVIWKGDKLIDGVAETIEELRAKGKRLVFVTNNSTKSRKEYAKKFASLGLYVSPEEIFASSFAAAAFLKSVDFPSWKTVYVIGEAGIKDELDLVGIKNFGGPEDANKTIDLSPGRFLSHDKGVGAVVVGFDRSINYYKIQYGSLCLRENSGCLFIATNTDAVTHLTDAQEWAGGGSMVGALRGASQKEPRVVGKPSTFMLDYLSKKFGISKSQICMVGDRLDTDILFGQRGGTKTLLVLSGVTSLADLQTSEVQPDFYANRLSDLRGNVDDEVEEYSKKPVARGRAGLRGRGRGRAPVRSAPRPAAPPVSYYTPAAEPEVEPVAESEPSYESESYEVERTPRATASRAVRGRVGRGRGRAPAARGASRSPSPPPSRAQEEESVSFWDATPDEAPKPAARRLAVRGRAGRGRGRSRSPVRSTPRSVVQEDSSSFESAPVDTPSAPRSRTVAVRGRAGMPGRGRGRSRSPIRAVSRSSPVEEETPTFEDFNSAPVASPSSRSRTSAVRGRAGMPGRGRGRSRSPTRATARSLSPSPEAEEAPVSYDYTPAPTPTPSSRPRALPVRGRAGMPGRSRSRGRSLSPLRARSPSPSREVEETPTYDYAPVEPPTPTPTPSSRPRALPVRGRAGMPGRSRSRGRTLSPPRARSPSPSREVEETPVSYDYAPVEAPTPAPTPSSRPRELPVRGRAGMPGRSRSRGRSLSPPRARSPSPSREVEETSYSYDYAPVEAPTPAPTPSSRPRVLPVRGRSGMPGRSRSRGRSPVRAVSRTTAPSPPVAEETPISYDYTPDEPRVPSTKPRALPVRGVRAGMPGRRLSRSRSPTRAVSRLPSPPPPAVEETPYSYDYTPDEPRVPSSKPRALPVRGVRAGMPGRRLSRSRSPTRALSRSPSPSPVAEETPAFDSPAPSPTPSSRPRALPVRGRAGMPGRGRSRSPVRPTSRSPVASPVAEEAPISFDYTPVESSTVRTAPKSRTAAVRGRAGMPGRGRRPSSPAARSVARPSTPAPEPEESSFSWESSVSDSEQVRSAKPRAPAAPRKGLVGRGRPRVAIVRRASGSSASATAVEEAPASGTSFWDAAPAPAAPAPNSVTQFLQQFRDNLSQILKGFL